MSAAVIYEAADGVALVRLNRPERHNAVNEDMRAALLDAWARFEADPGARVAVLCAAGQRSFCSGRDMAEPSGIGHRTFLPILGDTVCVSKPVIAAVQGDALGGGWFMAQMCDLVVAAEHVRFGLPEVKVGRVPAWAAQLRGMIGEKHMLQVMLTGTPISAADALRMGLVNAVVPDEAVMDVAMHWAAAIAANAPLALAAAKRIVYESAGLDRASALEHAFELARPVLHSADAAEGLAAFREKRAPVWRGR
ncbi:enoyl-CoA hydratase/isomerase family protein [Verticiella sediminum]|uniref:enoyl-CoA hydratase/isomerase family protein n=1 Tax=Verticiella sediminum TaxID=1247510 RepID=UPI001FEA65DE|nr:enoyl-CoA hydratase-related protein [Verticiella sediminum]